MSLQDFLPSLGNADTKKRFLIGTEILSYLESPTCSLECEDIGLFIDGIVQWLNSSNFKVEQNGLKILLILADRMKEDFRPYITTTLPATIDRMGDAKDSVREIARNLMLKLMDSVSSPQHIFDKLYPVFSHKNWRVREEVMLLLQDTLVRHGAHSLTFSKLMPHLAKLLGDPNSQVRDVAVATLVLVYKHVGEVIRKDLGKKHNVPQAKLQALFAKFDEVRGSGDAPIPSAPEPCHRSDEVDYRPQSSENAESDGTISKSTAKRASSAPPTRRGLFPTPKSPTAASTVAGAADEEMFIKSFEDVPRIQLYTAREMEQEMTKVRENLSDANYDWEKRVDSLKRLRSILIAGAADYDELYPNLRLLEPAFQLSVKDLRSQVVREACITIAYFAQQLGNRLDHFAEALLPHMINLIPNSAKIMSSAGTVAVRFIIQHTHVSRLIPIIANNLSAKSKDIRKACSEFLDQLLHTWSTHTLERHVALIQEAIKKGISDADPEARAFSRKAFWGFADHFREQADSLLNSLDSSKQRMLQGELTMSNSSSSNSLNSIGKQYRSSASSHGGSIENLSSGRSFGGGRLTSRSGIPILSPKNDGVRLFPGAARSNSAIDMAAVRRARNRAFASAAHLPRGSGASLPRIGSRRAESSTINAITSPERSRSRAKGVSHSQPNSRSGSPSSRLSYATYHMHSGDGSSSGRVRRKSGIPTAGGASRESSPTRSVGYERRPSGSRLGYGDRYALSSSALLVASLDAPQPLSSDRYNSDGLDSIDGDTISEPLTFDNLCQRITPRKRYSAFDDASDDSETSSICSDRSFSSFGRNFDDVQQLTRCLASVQWSERKEGLLGLQALLRSNRMLTMMELKKITDIFSKLFMDPHMKVFTYFLDTLNELIRAHKYDLRSWLFVLVMRLLQKLGGDILNSLAIKIHETLGLVRDSFPYNEQFNAVTRLVNDPTQTLNHRVKAAVLKYLHELLNVMEPGDYTSSSPETITALGKIISWRADPKGNDLKKPIDDIIHDLFKLNSTEFNVLMGKIPKSHQDTAVQVLNSHVRRQSSTDSNTSLGMKSPPSPLMHTYKSNSLTRMKGPETPQNSSFEYDDTENLMPEDYYNSLKKTSAEIQKYSQDRLDHDIFSKTTLHKLGNSNFLDGVIDKMDDFSSGSDSSSPSKRSPLDYNTAVCKDQNSKNAFNMQSLKDVMYETEMDLRDVGESPFQSIMMELGNHNIRNEQRKIALFDLMELTKNGSLSEWEENFREILLLVNDTIADTDGSIRALALRALCDLMQNQSQHFQGFVEMTVLKILESQNDPEREVVRSAEVCSATAASCLPPEHCVRTLKSIVMSELYRSPVQQAAIKMMTKLVEYHAKNVIIQLLPEMMPALLQAYDHTESSIRKASVFCMVDIYNVVGDGIKLHLEGLNSSKMKLLNLYIKRAQSQRSSSLQGESDNH